jgi:two-component system sensor histidine kinase BaeS
MMPRSECGWRSDHVETGREWHGSARARRIRFFRRLAALVFILFLFGIWGFVSAGRLILTRIFGVSSSGAAVWVPIGTLLLAFVALGILVRMAGRVGLPIRDVMDAAERVADGEYAVRVAERGPPPMRGLARAFNTMTARLGKHDEIRRNLMADIAHELRTPLSIIQGKLEGLLDGVYPRGDAQLAEILDETNFLSRLIEDLRTLALSEAGALTLEKESTDMSELAREAVRALANDASAQQVRLTVDAPAGPLRVSIDPVRIRQVLNNLLVNALQHTPVNGSVLIATTMTPQSEILVQVRDTGSGMTQEEVDRAFERFQKGPGSRGSGLGLAIARNLVVAHGGEIQVVSKPCQGTTISFTLPMDSQR